MNTSKLGSKPILIMCISIIFTAMAAGCVGLQKTVSSPRVTLAHIEVKEANAFETAFRIELKWGQVESAGKSRQRVGGESPPHGNG